MTISRNSGTCSQAKYKLCIAFAAALLFLSGCSRFLPQESTLSTEADGSIPVSSFLSIASAPDPLTLYDSKDALAADGLYYVSWTAGESTGYENEDGDMVDLFPAQATLLAAERKSAQAAESDIESWKSASKDNYNISDTRSESINGQEYEIITYTMKNSESPWKGGVSAFAVHGKAAICCELTFTDSFTGDPDRILLKLLECFTYKN